MLASKKPFYFIILLLASIVLTSFFMTANVEGQVSKFLDINQSFPLLESSTIHTEHQNAQNFNISLPSSLWTVNSIDLNFSNMQFPPQNETYEDHYYSNEDYYEIYWIEPTDKRLMIAVQFDLNVSSTIFGAFLWARKTPKTNETIKVEIRGYDPISEDPNATLYASANFTVSSESNGNWFFQNFSDPVSLPKGSYFLILNGSIIDGYKSERFFWYYNAMNDSLRVLEYINTWAPVTLGNPLFKLLKKVNVPIYPEEISMKVEINQENYPILNGISEGEGYFELSELEYYPNSDSLNFFVSNNVSNTLYFNATSILEIKKSLISPTTLRITENQPNQWTLTPTILRTSYNYSVRFDYPINWVNIALYKDNVDVTSQVSVDDMNKVVIIPNELITYDSDWEIKANSPLINFSLNMPRTEFEIGKELLFSISDAPEGNYTFLLYDITDVALESITKQIPPDYERFSFPIPDYFNEGNYRAVIFWNNFTDGGVTSQVFTFVSTPPIVTPDLGPLILTFLIIGISSAVAVFTYIAYKKFIKMRKYSLEKILTRCVDVFNINHIIVIDKKSGVDLFSQSFIGKTIEPTLVAGFLQAISNFGAEISEEAKESRTLKLEYKDSILLMNEFVNLRIIISMKENPSRNFLFSVDDLAFDIYKHYGDEIDKFRGNVRVFGGIEQLIEKHFGISFILPLKVVILDDQFLTLTEKLMVEKAQNLMKDNGIETFYSLHLLPENESTPKDYKTILNLIQKGIFQPQKQ